MNFTLFALVIAAAFFVCSLVLLNFGRHLGVRYLQRQKGAGSMAGLTTVEGAVFALIGLLLAFTISGALQRFDERRQLVIQEANAVSTAYDRLGLLEGGVSNNLQMKLKDYVRARIDLYRMPHDFSLWQQTELFSPKQQQNSRPQNQGLERNGCGLPISRLSARMRAGAACAFQCIRSRSTARRRQRKTSTADCLFYAFWS